MPYFDIRTQLTVHIIYMVILFIQRPSAFRPCGLWPTDPKQGLCKAGWSKRLVCVEACVCVKACLCKSWLV